MKRLLLPALLVLSINLLGQQIPLGFGSYAIKLGVAADGSMIINSKAGEAGMANSITGNWRPVGIHSMASTLEQPVLFNKDTGFVSGIVYIQNAGPKVIYRTTNGGKTWKAVDIGVSKPADDAINLDDGQAWISVASEGIGYTTDYGASWEMLKIPVTTQRFGAIFFNTQKHGIIGSHWNMLAYTTNNCASWQQLPTPLDQKKYNKTNINSRPELSRVAIFNDYFIVVQEGMVFYSRKDVIDWKWLPDYNDFYTDPANSGLYFKTNLGRFVRADNNLSALQIYNVSEASFDAKCRNGNLFILAGNEIMQIVPGSELVRQRIYTPPPKEGAYIGSTDDGSYYHRDNKIYLQKPFEATQVCLFTFPMPLSEGALTMMSSKLMAYDHKDSMYLFEMGGKLQKQISKKQMLADFGKPGIRTITFQTGVAGCFNLYRDNVEYRNTGEDFTNPSHSKLGGGRSGLPVYEATIDGGTVETFIKNLPAIFDPNNNATVEDLGFTNAEYERCKKDILAFKRQIEKGKTEFYDGFFIARNNLDFDKLVSLVDSVKTMPASLLNENLVNSNEIWSTTTYWNKIEFVNKNGEVLTISSSYYEPKAFYFPWRVSLNGYTTITTNIDINKFIDEVYPGFLTEKDKVQILHWLVKQSY